MDSETAVFERERPRLLGVAYALLGSHAEAEDAVQDAWLRFAGPREPIRDPEAWLTTVVSRLAIDRLRSARIRRETYPGVWLPEPVSHLPDPESSSTLRSMLSIAFLHLLERLTPEERAVIVLREAFERPYEEIAGVLGRSEATCRQLFSRARKRLQSERAGQFRPADDHIVRRCMEALTAGDEQQLLALLADEAVLYGDGGGKVPSVVNPVFGADRIARFFLGLLRKFPGGYTAQAEPVNGQPALLVSLDGRCSVLALAVGEERITALYAIANPDKLSRISPPGALLQSVHAER